MHPLDEESRCDATQHPSPCAPNKNRTPLQQARKQAAHAWRGERAAPSSEATAGRGGLDGVEEEADAHQHGRDRRDAHA